jgi:four helix bundle protein
MENAFNFENLHVWQKSKSLVLEIYKATSNFPDDEKFGLVSQLRRASISISSNIAEGSARFSQKEKNRFYQVAYGSAIEVGNQLIISNELGFLSHEELTTMRNKINEICKMVFALQKAIP